MANTTLTQTGAQVQAILDKADKLPSSLGTAGQVLTVNSGATAAEWQTPSGGGGMTMSWNSSFNGTFKMYFSDGTSISSLQADYRTTYHPIALEFKLFDLVNDYVHAILSGACIVGIKSANNNYGDYDRWYFTNNTYSAFSPLASMGPANTTPDYNLIVIPLGVTSISNFSITYD